MDLINSLDYHRSPSAELLRCNRQETKSILIARFGMLECGRNFKGTQNAICNKCNVSDDESHRLNDCIKYKSTNFCNNTNKSNFHHIFSNDVQVLRETVRDKNALYHLMYIYAYHTYEPLKCANGKFVRTN